MFLWHVYVDFSDWFKWWAYMKSSKDYTWSAVWRVLPKAVTRSPECSQYISARHPDLYDHRPVWSDQWAPWTVDSALQRDWKLLAKRNVSLSSFWHGNSQIEENAFYVCGECKPQEHLDMFCVVSFGKCARASQGNKFFSDVKAAPNLGNYSRGYLNFLVTFAGLYQKYSKFQKTLWDVTELKKYIFNYLPKRLEQDQDIWM